MALTLQSDGRVWAIIIIVISLLLFFISWKDAPGVHINVALQEKVLQENRVSRGAFLMGEGSLQAITRRLMQLYLHLRYTECKEWQ